MGGVLVSLKRPFVAEEAFIAGFGSLGALRDAILQIGHVVIILSPSTILVLGKEDFIGEFF